MADVVDAFVNVIKFVDGVFLVRRSEGLYFSFFIYILTSGIYIFLCEISLYVAFFS